MNTQKDKVWRLSVHCVLFLVLCTVVSSWVSHAMTAQVVQIQTQPGFVNQQEYRMLLPSSCVYQGGDGAYIFALKEVDGTWKVERRPVNVEDSDGIHTAISTSYLENIEVAAFPSQPLHDGDLVRVVK